MNAPFVFTVDVEEFFHAWALAPLVPRDAWEDFRSRVRSPTERLLDLLAEYRAHATFFVLGRVARRHPRLVRRIVAEGHELASHGSDHRLVYRQTADQFRADVADSRRLLEDIGGVPVRGFRAANFSIDHRSPWAHAILAEEGYRYSSSSHPVANDRYGAPTGGREPRTVDGLLEVPVAAFGLWAVNLPCGGGGYLRLLPYGWTRFALGRLVRRRRAPVVFYTHPWELDPGQPRPPGLSATTRLRHCARLARTARLLDDLLRRFGSERLDRALGLPAGEAAVPER